MIAFMPIQPQLASTLKTSCQCRVGFSVIFLKKIFNEGLKRETTIARKKIREIGRWMKIERFPRWIFKD